MRRRTRRREDRPARPPSPARVRRRQPPTVSHSLSTQTLSPDNHPPAAFRCILCLVMRPVSQSRCLRGETGSTPVRGARRERSRRRSVVFAPVAQRKGAPEKLNRSREKRGTWTCSVCAPGGDVPGECGARWGGPRVSEAPGTVSRGRCREASFPNGSFARAVRVRLPSGALTFSLIFTSLLRFLPCLLYTSPSPRD